MRITMLIAKAYGSYGNSAIAQVSNNICKWRAIRTKIRTRMLLKILSDFLTCARPKLRDVPSVRRFTGGPGQCSLRSCAWAQILRPSARSQQSANDPKRLQMDTEMYEAEKCSALILADTHRFTAAKF